MGQSPLTLYVHELLYELACYKKVGMAFQIWFEDIMEIHDPSFIRIKPNGWEGDWKADGVSMDEGVVYQCYAPENLTARKASAKVREDFIGAYASWQRHMKGWVLVCGAPKALPPMVVDTILELKAGYPLIAISHWSRHQLWQVVKELPEASRNSLLGHVPPVEEAAEVTAAEVQTLLNFLVRQGRKNHSDDMSLTDLSDKLDRNRLGEGVRSMISAALPVARVVEDYTHLHPDIHFSSVVASALATKYNALAHEDDRDMDKVFMELVMHVCQGRRRHIWAASGIVAYYFELCEVFER